MLSSWRSTVLGVPGTRLWKFARPSGASNGKMKCGNGPTGAKRLSERPSSTTKPPRIIPHETRCGTDRGGRVSDELKPCPFCGGEAAYEEVEERSVSDPAAVRFSVGCDNED